MEDTLELGEQPTAGTAFERRMDGNHHFADAVLDVEGIEGAVDVFHAGGTVAALPVPDTLEHRIDGNHASTALSQPESKRSKLSAYKKNLPIGEEFFEVGQLGEM
jgi:hypothetical protein